MSYDRALEKAKWYCSFQERSRLDLEQRFFAWHVAKSDWDKIISYLIDENYFNETRFVEAYVRGKFRIKKWGRNKIILGLLQKKISNKLINEAIHREIEEEEYLQMINELIDKKIQLINESDELKKRDKIYRYLISKGYESELVANELNSI